MNQTFLPRILKEKEQEVAQLALEDIKPLRQTYSFYEFLQTHQDRVQIIAEVKKASPSLGDINPDVDVLAQAKSYETAGASMISVLTDPQFFKGDINYLRQISKTVGIPTLAKDFIIDEKQIIRSRNAGATVILLIVAALAEERLKELYAFANKLGLEVLVETHNAKELAIAHRLGAKIIGVNNRDLVSFKVSLETTQVLADHFKTAPVYVSESGFFTGQDVEQVAPYVNAVLVGTALMTSNNLSAKVKELQVDKG
ncbi:indole-3-glycerol phosphate synthase TrpC [Streptococcus dentasini]